MPSKTNMDSFLLGYVN